MLQVNVANVKNVKKIKGNVRTQSESRGRTLKLRQKRWVTTVTGSRQVTGHICRAVEGLCYFPLSCEVSTCCCPGARLSGACCQHGWRPTTLCFSLMHSLSLWALELHFTQKIQRRKIVIYSFNLSLYFGISLQNEPQISSQLVKLGKKKDLPCLVCVKKQKQKKKHYVMFPSNRK